ncbi:hypothetical protein AD949_12520 [Acetobacter orleanensis]|nr:hypothetical protein AD949_12520 [Acetobacter orleanensis]
MLAGFASLAALAGCQSAPGAVQINPTPHTLIYSYVIASGMARGQVMSGRVPPARLVQIVNADRAALAAIVYAEYNPSSAGIKNAGQAMENFLAVIEPPDSSPTSVVRR